MIWILSDAVLYSGIFVLDWIVFKLSNIKCLIFVQLHIKCTYFSKKIVTTRESSKLQIFFFIPWKLSASNYKKKKTLPHICGFPLLKCESEQDFLFNYQLLRCITPCFWQLEENKSFSTAIIHLSSISGITAPSLPIICLCRQCFCFSGW